MDDHPELEFFNSLSGHLDIELSTPAEPVARLLNLQAAPEAQIVRLELRAEVYEPAADEPRPLTPEEYDRVAFRGAGITLRSEDGDPVTHAAPNGEFFTVRELLKAVEETERRTRGQTEWLGGVDVHHVFFEGIHREDEDDSDDGEGEGDVWDIYWGS